jgi:hypothetical protein
MHDLPSVQQRRYAARLVKPAEKHCGTGVDCIDRYRYTKLESDNKKLYAVMPWHSDLVGSATIYAAVPCKTVVWPLRRLFTIVLRRKYFKW